MILNGENQVADIEQYTNGSTYDSNQLDTTSTSYVSSGGSVTFLNCSPGDRLMIGVAYIGAADSSSAGDYIVRVTDGGGTFDLAETQRQSDLVAGERLIGLTTTYLVVNGGTVIVTLMAKRVIGSGHIYVRNPVSINAQRLRK